MLVECNHDHLLLEIDRNFKIMLKKYLDEVICESPSSYAGSAVICSDPPNFLEKQKYVLHSHLNVIVFCFS